MDESLLRELVARILASPQMETLLKTAAVGVPEKKACLVVLENEQGLSQLPELERRWGGADRLRLCVAGPAELPLGARSRVSVEEAMGCDQWTRVLVPVCSGEQLAAVAAGIATDKVCGIIAHAIRCGIPVDICRLETGFTPKTPEAYRALFAGYVRQVAAYGISVGSSAGTSGTVAGGGKLTTASATAVISAGTLPDRLPWSFGEPVRAQAPASRSTVTYPGGLMTEKEAILLPEHAILQLGGGTVLTPSAIDALKKLKVQVFKEGVRFM